MIRRRDVALALVTVALFAPVLMLARGWMATFGWCDPAMVLPLLGLGGALTSAIGVALVEAFARRTPAAA